MCITSGKHMNLSTQMITYRNARLDDVNELVALEKLCFEADRLSRRSFRHHIQSEHSDLILAEYSDTGRPRILAYGLSLRQRGTRLARLYSLAVLPDARGLGLGKEILTQLEDISVAHNRLFMRLEVSKSNQAAIRLYETHGYRVFGQYANYYQDHGDALRMQKTIRHVQPGGFSRITPWYQQSTDFTCGPAALMMGMASLDDNSLCERSLEIDIWREATTVFMTSGHGGSHPLGLALAARRRGFFAEVAINTDQPLFVDGVRSNIKKEIITLVHHQFLQACDHKGILIQYLDVSQFQVEQWLRKGYAVVVLISTYRLHGKKAPHWVVVTGIDDSCLYVHDPDLDSKTQIPIDCQYVPIAREDFDKMATFGVNRLRCAVAISRLKKDQASFSSGPDKNVR